jgi:5-methylcytosine-specific restriction enzyme A
MPTRPPLHRAPGWQRRQPWQRSSGQLSTEHPLPRHWPQLRQLVLAQEPLCRPCNAAGRTSASVEVDHIVARSRGGTSARANLQGICVTCHRSKTAREARS